MESPAWSFRADRCATPAVFARGGGLITSELSPLGQSGVGFAYRDGAPEIWLDFPYREEPLAYDGSETPAPPDVQTHQWQPGESVDLDVRETDGEWREQLRPEAALHRRHGSRSRRRPSWRRTGSIAGTTERTRRG